MIWPTFDDFWNAYQKKVGKPLAIIEWGKLTQQEKEEAMNHIPAYIESRPEKRYRLDPCRYLKRKTFQDEIITNGKQQTNSDLRKLDLLSGLA